MKNSKTFWNRAAAKYAKDPISDPQAYEYTRERTRSYLSKSDRVLEVGCGTGSTAIELADSLGQIVASDISGEMIKIGAQKAEKAGIKNIEFAEGTLDDLIYADEEFDVILAHNVLHLIPDQHATLDRIHALLKPGGTFISKTICTGTKSTLKFRIMISIVPLMQLIGLAPFVKIRTISEMDQMVTNAGFKIVETGNYPARPPSRYIVAMKA